MGMKCGMAQTRQNWILSNHISREHKQLDFMQKLQSFQAHQTELMSEQEFQNLLQEISVKRGQMSQLLQELQRVKLEQSDRLSQSLTPRYQEAIEALVLSDKYDLVLPRQSVHYRHELYDVTAKITEKMNALEK